MNKLKIIFMMFLYFAYFTSGMENLNVVPTTNLDDTHNDDTPRFLKFSQIDSPIQVIHEIPPRKKDNDLNQTKQKKKKKFNLFSCSCYKTKSKKKYKSKEMDDDPTSSINTKIKIKNFDQSKIMVRKTSAPTQSVSTPIMLTRRFSEESVKSAVFLSRKSSAESVKSPTLLIRKSSAPSNNLSRKTSTENLGRKFSAKRNEIAEKEKATQTLEEEEEASEYVDICSFDFENVLCYVCLQENVENCEKCKTLNHIFQTQTFEDNYLLYKLFLHEIYNPNQHDLEIMPVWLELVLSSLLAEQQDMTFSITTFDHESGRQNSYRSKRRYAKLLTKYCAQIRPKGGHLFFSVLKSKFLEKYLQFFVNNDIITIEDDAMFIGDQEGLHVFANDKFENIFLFGGMLAEVKKYHYKPTVGDVVFSNVNLYACTEDQFDILKNTSMKVEKVDSKTGWILISNVIHDKQQWISPEDFMHIFSGLDNMISEIKEPTSGETESFTKGSCNGYCYV